MSTTPAVAVDLDAEETQRALAEWVAAAGGAEQAQVTSTARLSGGAIHANWRVDVELGGGPHEGALPLVLRAESTAPLARSHTVAQEFAIARLVRERGVTVPEPLWLCEEPAVIGRPFSLTRWTEGTAAAHRLVREEQLGGPRSALLERLGAELAAIHAITPPQAELSFLDAPSEDSGLDAVAQLRDALDGYGRPRPALEWGLRWLELHAPPAGDVVLTHGDFRTGNYMVDEAGLRGLLDWEFAHWGDPLEDIGWFTARCWRFGRADRPAGGLGPREDFYRGYRQASGRDIDPATVRYWEILAHVRWAVIAIEQGERHASGLEPSLELALTGRIPSELELETLLHVEAAERGVFHD